MKRQVGIAVLTAAVLLVATGCGRDDTPTDSSPSGSTSASSSGAEQEPAGAFGDLGEVCGPGDASGATDVGVTDDSITVSTIADVGWSVAPGLLQPIFDAADIFTGWCNEAGGINGRTIELTKRDSAYSNYLPQVEAACDTDLALVGSMGILDATGVDAWNECDLVNFTAATVGLEAADADRMFPLTPIPLDQVTIGGMHTFFEENPDLAGKVGSLYAAGPSADRTQGVYNQGIENIGGTIVYTATYAATTTNWAPYVQAMRDAGVELMFLNASVAPIAALQQAMATAGWYPEVQLAPSQLYDEGIVELGGEGLQGDLFTFIPTTPFEATDVPAVEQLLSLIDQYAPDAKRTFFLSTAFSGWLLFAKAVQSCGSDVTRDCIIDYVGTQTEWTGGGLQGAIDPAANVAAECFAVMRVTPDGFTQEFPDTLGNYDCSPDNAPHVSP